MAVENPVILENATLLDVHQGELQPDRHLMVADGLIREISETPIKASAARRVDLAGRILMPGLIDCHVHVTAAVTSLAASALLPDSYVALKTRAIMHGMLRRGFTTVRDLGGADYGLVRALEEDLIEGPRLVICGKALSQTGGHGDFRGRYDERHGNYFDRRLGSIARICDGVDAVRAACREEIKAGASFIKIMANGGVASPTDPVGFLGFSRAELDAAVEEARSAQTYVAAHLYTDEAIRRAVEAGVRSVEHANLIERPTAEFMAHVGAFACPTLITYEALRREGANYGIKADTIAKVEEVRLRGAVAVDIMHQAGVRIVYGTDLLGELHRYQSDGLALMADILPPAEVIRSATVHAAELLDMTGQLGCIVEGAFADLIVIADNPLDDISTLSRGEEAVLMVMKGGRIFKSGLE